MAHERPQVPQPDANYPAHSHADMYRQATDGNDPGQAGEIAAEWKAIGAQLTEVAVGLNTVVNGLRAGWTGAAGAAASGALTTAGNFTDKLSATFTATGGAVERQVEAAAAAKNKFPQEVPYNPQQMLRDAATSWNPFKMVAAPFEMMEQREKSQAAKQEAERVMQERDTALAAAAGSMPVFDATPQVTSGQQDVTTTSSTSSTSLGHTTGSVNPNTQLGNPGIGNPGIGNPGIGNPGISNLGISNLGISNPGTANTGTTNTAWAAPPVTTPPASPLPVNGVPGERGQFGPGPGPLAPGIRPGPNGQRVPGNSISRGGPGGPAGRGGTAGGRGPGGFGSANPGAAAGRGTFGPANPGGSAGVGHGPEATARGGGAGTAGRNGAPGATGAGAGAGAGKGDEDDIEHKSQYLVPTDEYFEDDRMVAPPVIGG